MSPQILRDNARAVSSETFSRIRSLKNAHVRSHPFYANMLRNKSTKALRKTMPMDCHRVDVLGISFSNLTHIRYTSPRLSCFVKDRRSTSNYRCHFFRIFVNIFFLYDVFP